MSKSCPICGSQIGFFSGKFIEEKYVCKVCYEADQKHCCISDNANSKNHTWIKMADAFAKPYKYQKWAFGKKNK